MLALGDTRILCEKRPSYTILFTARSSQFQSAAIAPVKGTAELDSQGGGLSENMFKKG